MNRDILGKVAWVLFIVLATLFVVQIIIKLTGHSPSDAQILYVGFGAIVSYLLAMSYKLGEFVGEVREFMKTTKNTFRKLGKDISKK